MFVHVSVILNVLQNQLQLYNVFIRIVCGPCCARPLELMTVFTLSFHSFSCQKIEYSPIRVNLSLGPYYTWVRACRQRIRVSHSDATSRPIN